MLLGIVHIANLAFTIHSNAIQDVFFCFLIHLFYSHNSNYNFIESNFKSYYWSKNSDFQPVQH